MSIKKMAIGLDEKLNFLEIKMHSIKSIKWTVLNEIALRSIQPIIALILARLLTPKEFGLIGAAMIIIGFTQIFQEFGFSKTLIQRETDINNSANVIFWSNLSLAFVIYFLLFVSAPLFAGFFKESGISVIIRVLSLQIIFSSFIIVPQALCKRDFRFKQLFFVKLLSVFISGVISITLVLFGFGVWALVWGVLSDTFIQALVFWLVGPWRPKLSYDLQLARELFGFSSWIVLETFLGWLMVWGDSIAVGRFLGIKELGVYSVGVMVLAAVSGFFYNPIASVAYSSFSRLQSMPEQLRDYFIKIIQVLATLILPVGICIVLLAKPISLIFLGEKWHGIGIVFIILGIKDTLSTIFGINFEVLKAIGKPNVNAIIYLVSTLFFIPVYLIAAPHGLLIFCFARLLVAIFTLILGIFAVNKFIKIYFLQMLFSIKYQFIAAFIAGIVVCLFNYFEAINSYLGLAYTITSGLTIYAVFLWLLDKDLFMANLRHARIAFISGETSVN